MYAYISKYIMCRVTVGLQPKRPGGEPQLAGL